MKKGAANCRKSTDQAVAFQFKWLGSCRISHILFFKIKKKLLFVQSTCITNQLAIGPDDTVAGDKDGKRVAFVCHTNGAACVFHAYGACNFPVASCLAIWNFQQGSPDLLPEGCTFPAQGNIKDFSPAAEIFLQLCCGHPKQIRFPSFPMIGIGNEILLKKDMGQYGSVFGNADSADGSLIKE